MNTVYIAGPMSGLPNHNYPAFNAAAADLAVAGHQPLNPAMLGTLFGEGRTWEWFMRRTIRMLTEADGVALLPGWEDSRGASIECDIAGDLSIPCKPVAEWLGGGQG